MILLIRQLSDCKPSSDKSEVRTFSKSITYEIQIRNQILNLSFKRNFMRKNADFQLNIYAKEFSVKLEKS